MQRSFSATAAMSMVVLMGIARGAQAADDASVLVLPFADASGQQASIGVEKTIQQSLTGDLGRAGTFKPVTRTENAATDDLATAISAARAANVPYVVYGAYEVRGDHLRVVANTVDVANMHLMGGVRVERKSRDLWSATDALSGHVMGHLNGARAGGIATAGNQVGGSTISRVQMPFAIAPLSYIDFSRFAKPYTGRNPAILPGTVVVDAPLALTSGRLIPGGRQDARPPFSNAMQDGPGLGGNVITGGDGNVAVHPPHEMQSGPGNTIERGDGNTMKFNPGKTTPTHRDFSNTMRPNYGGEQNNNTRAAGQSGNGVSGGSGNAVRSSGNAVRSSGGNQVSPPKDR
ncbi:MAG: hypothetical protein WBD40_21455 [Tepidisphaeraceae bacterium]